MADPFEENYLRCNSQIALSSEAIDVHLHRGPRKERSELLGPSQRSGTYLCTRSLLASPQHSFNSM